MRLVTAANLRYFGNIRPYLESVVCHMPITLICTGGSYLDFERVTSITLSREQNTGAPYETESPQHGSFLQVVPGDPNEILIFTDGDIIMQRAFSDGENNLLEHLEDGEVWAGYNSGPNETLDLEGSRLFPRFARDTIERRMGYLAAPCYNIGVFAARRSTYQAIYDAYMPNWELVSEAFGHPARQQWLVCHTIARLGIKVSVTPYSFHANGHYGMPPGCYYRDGLLYSGSEAVLFRHKL